MKKMTKEMVFNKIRRTTFKAIFTIILGLLKIARKVLHSLVDTYDSFDGKEYCDVIFNLGEIEDKSEELLNVNF